MTRDRGSGDFVPDVTVVPLALRRGPKSRRFRGAALSLIRMTGTAVPLKFEKNTEAFLAVLSVVLSADNVGSLDERDLIFKKVKGLAIFNNPSMAEFSKLLGKVTDVVYSELPQEDGAITDAGVDMLLA